MSYSIFVDDALVGERTMGESRVASDANLSVAVERGAEGKPGTNNALFP